MRCLGSEIYNIRFLHVCPSTYTNLRQKLAPIVKLSYHKRVVDPTRRTKINIPDYEELRHNFYYANSRGFNEIEKKNPKTEIFKKN